MTEEEQGPASADVLGTPEQYAATLALAAETKKALTEVGVDQRLVAHVLAGVEADHAPTGPNATEPAEDAEWMAAVSVGEDPRFTALFVSARRAGGDWHRAVLETGKWTKQDGSDDEGVWQLSPISGAPWTEVTPPEAESLDGALKTVVADNRTAAEGLRAKPPFALSQGDGYKAFEHLVTPEAVEAVRYNGGHEPREVTVARQLEQQDLLSRMYSDLQLQEATS